DRPRGVLRGARRELAGGRAPPRAGPPRGLGARPLRLLLPRARAGRVGAAGGLRPRPDRRPSRGTRGRRGVPGAPRPAVAPARRPTKFAISASWARSWASESAAGAGASKGRGTEDPWRQHAR